MYSVYLDFLFEDGFFLGGSHSLATQLAVVVLYIYLQKAAPLNLQTMQKINPVTPEIKPKIYPSQDSRKGDYAQNNLSTSTSTSPPITI